MSSVELVEIIVAALVFLLAMLDAWLVTHRRPNPNRKRTVLSEDEQDDLLRTDPREWAQAAADAVVTVFKGIKES